MCSVKAVHSRPTVGPLFHIGWEALRFGNVDQSRHKSCVPLTVYRRTKLYDWTKISSPSGPRLLFAASGICRSRNSRDFRAMGCCEPRAYEPSRRPRWNSRSRGHWDGLPGHYFNGFLSRTHPAQTVRQAFLHSANRWHSTACTQKPANSSKYYGQMMTRRLPEESTRWINHRNDSTNGKRYLNLEQGAHCHCEVQKETQMWFWLTQWRMIKFCNHTERVLWFVK